MSEAHSSTTAYFRVFAALLALTALTVVLAFVNMEHLNNVVALAVAAAKAALVILYFMHLRASTPLTKLFLGAGFFWLVLLIVLTMSDVLTRAWIPRPDSWPGAS